MDADEIREKKRRALLDRLEREGTGGAGTADGPARSADDPIYVDGEDHLDEVVSTHRLVFVDFYADWCGPCKVLDPVLAEVAAETDAVVAKVDVDAHGILAQQVGVRGVPTVFLYVEGEPVKRHVGAQSQATLFDLVERFAGDAD